jgi:hypothetical protein
MVKKLVLFFSRFRWLVSRIDLCLESFFEGDFFHCTKNFISMELEFKEFNMVWKVLNVNGPYADRNSFWDNMLVSGIMPHSPFILGGDMNFTSSISEVRENYPRLDPSKAYFIHYFEALHLVNVKPIKLAPTWQNLCSPEDAVSKRLDRFFVS